MTLGVTFLASRGVRGAWLLDGRWKEVVIVERLLAPAFQAEATQND